MAPILADGTEPIPVVLGDSGYSTGVLLSPVFVEGGARRRRLLARWGYLTAAACLAYLVMLGVSLTASPVIRPGATKPASSAVGAVTTPTPRPARAVPREAPPVEVPAAKALVDGDAAQDAPVVLRLALPVTSRPAPPKPPGTPRLTPAPRPHRGNDDRETTHPPTISTTPVASAAASKTATPRRSAP
jgi:hypothetical protein